MDKIYRRFIRMTRNFPEVVYEKKKLVMLAAMSSEINTLGHYLDIIADVDRHTLDFTLQSLVKALVEVIAFFPVYRTYTSGFEVSERDRRYIEYAVKRAKRKNPAMSAAVFDFIRDVLLLDIKESTDGASRCIRLDFTMRFQQITGPVMAKGAEDTAFYSFNRLVSLNEVGGVPERFGLSLADFHRQNQERLASRPHTMLATSTHDTKPSEDVRARINVISEMPLAWREALGRWSRLNRRHKSFVEGQLSPDRNEEYLLYQTLVGAWPLDGSGDEVFALFRQRIREYMLKALREAKVNSSWITPNPAWEESVDAFVSTILDRAKAGHFLREMEKFQEMTTSCGMFNSLSQTLLKIASPGVPDFYQGSELWDFSLVDPDNRRPVNFGLRRTLLEELIRQESITGTLETARDLVATRNDGRIKLYLTRKALLYRRENRELLESGGYRPLTTKGVCQENVCAFERSVNGKSVLVVAPRFCSRLIGDKSGLPLGPDVWRDTRLLHPTAASSCYRNIFTGEFLIPDKNEDRLGFDLRNILSVFPVALLERVDRLC
jgi:(1->4)-alpha-D-glucan 1-alpha-D-glucosylmutase